MANIITLIPPKGLFSNIRRIVPNPLKGASNENEIKSGARRIQVVQRSVKTATDMPCLLWH
jgi:hypothetical protein